MANYPNNQKYRLDLSRPLTWKEGDENERYPTQWEIARQYLEGQVTLYDDSFVSGATGYGALSYFQCIQGNTGATPGIPTGMTAPYTNLYWERIGAPAIGLAGPTGPTGSPGAPGPAGMPGTAGSTGQTGGTGNPGPTGQTGQQGQTGSPGSPGAPGAQGPTGGTGNIGNDGPTGSTGGIGNTGPQGPGGTGGAVLKQLAAVTIPDTLTLDTEFWTPLYNQQDTSNSGSMTLRDSAFYTQTYTNTSASIQQLAIQCVGGTVMAGDRVRIKLWETLGRTWSLPGHTAGMTAIEDWTIYGQDLESGESFDLSTGSTGSGANITLTAGYRYTWSVEYKFMDLAHTGDPISEWTITGLHEVGIGPEGPQGPTGGIGDTGPQGPIGIPGAQGITGPTGPTATMGDLSTLFGYKTTSAGSNTLNPGATSELLLQDITFDTSSFTGITNVGGDYVEWQLQFPHKYYIEYAVTVREAGVTGASIKWTTRISKRYRYLDHSSRL